MARWTRWEFDRFGIKLRTNWGWENIGGRNEWTAYQTILAIGRLRLHCFHRPDGDAEPHDHMWDFWTFPLVSYTEQVYRDHASDRVHRKDFVKRFRLHHRKAEHMHRLTGPADKLEGRVWTIVWTGKKRREWGFLTKSGWVPWREFLKDRL